MKAGILVIGACMLLFLSFTNFFVPNVKAQSLLDQTAFCTSGSVRPCPDVGICTGRTKTCDSGKWSEQCTGGVQPASQEICDNGLDDNCDGLVDECVSLSGSIGIFMIIGGVMLLIFALALSRTMK